MSQAILATHAAFPPARKRMHASRLLEFAHLSTFDGNRSQRDDLHMYFFSLISLVSVFILRKGFLSLQVISCSSIIWLINVEILSSGAFPLQQTYSIAYTLHFELSRNNGPNSILFAKEPIDQHVNNRLVSFCNRIEHGATVISPNPLVLSKQSPQANRIPWDKITDTSSQPCNLYKSYYP